METKSWNEIREQVQRLKSYYRSTKSDDLRTDINRWRFFVRNVGLIELRYLYNFWLAYSFGVVSDNCRLTREQYTRKAVNDEQVRVGDKVAYLRKFGNDYNGTGVIGVMYAKVLDVFDDGDIRTDWDGVLTRSEFIKVGVYE